MKLRFDSLEEAKERSMQEAQKQGCDMVNTRYYWSWSDDEIGYYLLITDDSLLTEEEILRLE
jgi:hypothetical protein